MAVIHFASPLGDYLDSTKYDMPVEEVKGGDRGSIHQELVAGRSGR